MATPLPAFMFVFSAHAEVVPISLAPKCVFKGILRARGGSSILPRSVTHNRGYSPRTRR